MGVFTYETEVSSFIPPSKMFKAFVLDVDLLGGPLPNIVPLPQAIKNVEILEGDGGPGTIKKITFGVDSKFKYLKHKIEGIDKENFTYSYSVIEGDALMDTLEKISYEIKLTPSPNGGSICKSTCKYHTKGDIEIKEDEIKGSKERASGLFKVVESYLLANPDTYN
ncbi:major allergen Pru ar 1-like [Quercus robur]|uniref:major allergen Pru ar 1-like n=1 Tax=Quercus robur TaxID=38942 RepID=UPI0021611CC4|nr:major allergen Pru ar 1-like [Quercus robur]